MSSSQIDYPGLLLTIVVAAAIGAIGIAIDRFLLPRERNALSDRLATWWVIIDDLKIPDLPVIFARLFVRGEKALLGETRLSPRWILTTLAISLPLTFVTLFVGDIWKPSVQNSGFEGTIKYFIEKPRFLMYPLNYLFDMVTMMVTIGVMVAIQKTGNLLRFTLLAMDVVLAVTLAYCMYSISNSIEYWGDGASTIEPTGIQVEYIKIDMQGYLSYWEYFGLFDWGSSVSQWLSEHTNNWFGPHPAISQGHLGGLSNFLPGNTTLIPTLIYLSILGALLASVATLRLVKSFALRVLALDVETEKSIFFYTASLVALVSVIAKAVVELLKAFQV